MSLSSLLISSLLLGSTYRVNLKLPAEPVVAITADQSILVVPFVLVEGESDEKPKYTIDLQVELTEYLVRTLRKKEFSVFLDRNVYLPTSNLEKLVSNQEFWKDAAETHGASFILSGSVDFRAEDRSTYETQEFVSRYNGRTYYRQILVERTGFFLELLLYIFDGEGALLKELPLKTFLEYEVRNYDQLSGFFEALLPMEEEIINLFVPHKAKQRRHIFGF